MARGTVLAQGQMAATRAAEDLRNNIRDEQELYNHFLMAVRSLLTPIQSAIVISHVSCTHPSVQTLSLPRIARLSLKESAIGLEIQIFACLPSQNECTTFRPAVD